MILSRSSPRRYVSTGPRKSQMAIVGAPSKISVLTPDPVEINKFISSVPGKRECNRPRLPVTPPKFPQNMPQQVAGEFLAMTGSCSKKTFSDPFVIETAFFPTFHSFHNEFYNMFEHKPVEVADPKISPTKPSEDNATDHSQQLPSWGELPWKSSSLTPTQENLDNSKRGVTKEIVLPRELKHLDSEERLKVFNHVHRFDESDAKNDAEKKDIGGFPGRDHTTIPTGQFIIHSDRSSFIINKDLYITNRILDKLKKRDKESSTEGEPSHPVVKTSSYENDEKLPAKRPADPISECTLIPAHKSKSDTDFLLPPWTYLGTATDKDVRNKSGHVNPANELGIPLKEISKSYSGGSVLLRNGLKDPVAPSKLPSNVEFRNPPCERMSPLEFRAFESRKNLYKRMVRNTPCYLVGGLHIQSAIDSNDSPKLPDDSFSKGDSEEINIAPTCLPVQVEGTIPWEFSVHKDEHLDDLEQDHVSDPQKGDLEEWFVPLGKEIDSMLSTMLATKSTCLQDLGPTENQICQELELDKDPTDFKDCVDLIGDSEIVEVAGAQLGNELLQCNGLEDIESAFMKYNRDSGTLGSELIRFKSSSTTSKTPVPPKQSNPNVDIKTETTIKCCRSGDNTDINVIETQRYLDKRLPYPFSTETVLQVYGTNDSLYKATQAVENSKSQLVHLSNANSPNPGMVVPKLQFNHMLSKTHELTNQNANKKKVLKIKIVPNSASQFSSPSNVSPSEPLSVSQVLHAPKNPSSGLTRDASDLKKKSKYPHKTTSKKIRRSESVKQLRSRKKQSTEEIGENITVLGPKDLERMFPTPPKPKPVEKPRNVTINNQAPKTNVNYSALSLVGTAKAITKITLKAKKKNDQWSLVKKKTGPSMSNESEGIHKIPHASAKLDKEPSAQKLVKNNREAGLSSRDQKILKSIISNKVKDSYTAVSQREKVIKENAERTTNDGGVKTNLTAAGQPYRSRDDKIDEKRVADKAVLSEKSANPIVKAKEKLLEDLFKGSENLVSQSTRKENQTNQVTKEFENILAKPSPLDDLLGRVQVPDKSVQETESVVERQLEKPVSPTPLHNRQYLTGKKRDQDINSNSLTEQRTAEQLPKSPIEELEEHFDPKSKNVKPIAPKVIRSSPDITDDPLQDNYSNRPKSAASSVKLISRSNADNFSHSNKPDPTYGNAKSKLNKLSATKVMSHNQQFKLQKQRKQVVGQTVQNLKVSAQQPKKQWKVPPSPMFFPFETPTVKELEHNLDTPEGESLPKSPSSSDPQVYEADFCKLSTESSPGLDVSSQARCKVPLTRVKEFPMINETRTSYIAPKTAISIKPNNDIMLRRTLSLMPAVTKVLGATLSAKSQQALDRWKQGLISTLGEEGYQHFVENQLRQGSNFHSAVGKFLLNDEVCKDDLCMKSMKNVFPHITDIGVIESQVVHPQLAYRGVVDCVAKYKGKPVAVEWKRSDKSKPTIKHTYDAPLQLSAYIGALNFDNHYKLQVEGGIVVVAYSDGSPATVFEIPLEECQRYWSKWLKRLYQFYSQV
uniref:Mitochondrial genome maintenance exonuclease 1 n=1 Tax=Lygus hesperus TaxID=30085 RepID=A0A0K8TCI1_LYGHE